MDVVVKEGNGWRRGWLEKIGQASGMVRVRLGDHGWSTWRSMHETYHLEDRFRDLPWQAFAYGLAYTGSVMFHSCVGKPFAHARKTFQSAKNPSIQKVFCIYI